MNAIRILAIVLIISGALGLVYGGFSYTKDTHQTTVGPVALTIQDRESVTIPVFVGIGAIVAGLALILIRK